MPARIIDGRAVAQSLHDEVAAEVAALSLRGERPPSLHVVLCGDHAASATYVRNKTRVAEKVGISLTLHTPAESSTTLELVELVDRLNNDEAVDAILVQLPLPPHVDQSAVVIAVAPDKDADGFQPLNFGRLAQGGLIAAPPCTPSGCIELMRRHDIVMRGARAVVLGRSTIVGRPMALMLLNEDATVTICHTRTRDLEAICLEADILVVAIGHPGTVTAAHVKPGACVIDVGITPGDGGVHGDVDFDSVSAVAGHLTPVPGGVGPMTIAMLMRNTVTLARARRGGAAAVTG